VSVYPTDGCDRTSLFRSADIEMYRNKSARKTGAGGALLKHDGIRQQTQAVTLIPATLQRTG
jgi:predicted signal transduction protein with EAL and GGDEF domain